MKSVYKNQLHRPAQKMRSLSAGFLAILLAVGTIVSGCGAEEEDENVVYVYNWGDYFDPDVLDIFEEETGITAIVDEFETNEAMYPKVAAGGTVYDVICPSDYMIQKMIENDLLAPLDFEKLPNAKEYIGEEYYAQSEYFDPGNVYSVPYAWGTLGILYNTSMVDEEIDSWDALWDEQYRDDILMLDSVRDAFSIALMRLGYSFNTTDPEELEEARDMLCAQKELVQAYGVDEIRDKMVSGEAKLGVIFSGDALIIHLEDENLEYVVPKEGTNIWIDSWVITKDAPHMDNAHAFIDFMCRPDIALLNYEYLTYHTPNTAVEELEEDPDYLESPYGFPDMQDYLGNETFQYLGDEMDRLYNDLWIQVKSY